MILFYLSYPFSDNPDLRTQEAIHLARKIMKMDSNIFVIVPHITFNSILPIRIGAGRGLRCIRIAGAELETIERCDGFIIGCDRFDEMSVGMLWETAFARKIGKKILQVVFDPENDGLLALKEVTEYGPD